MRCSRCKQKIEYGLDKCPYCGNNVSFSIKKLTDEEISDFENVETVIGASRFSLTISGVIVIIAIYLFIKYLNPLSVFYVNGVVRIIDIVLKTSAMVGVVLLIYNAWNVIKNKERIRTSLLIFAVILIAVPMLFQSIFENAGLEISLIDYSKKEYIELGAESIPSLFSVVGEKQMIISFDLKDECVEGIEIECDVIAIMYSGITEDEKSLYDKALINSGFELIYYYADDKKESAYVKNNIDLEEFYVVNISDSVISYARANGRYQDILESGV